MPARLPWIALGGALALALALGARLLDGRAPVPAPEAEPVGGGVLARALEVEVEQRRRLAREVAALREEVLRLSMLLGYAELAEAEAAVGDAAGASEPAGDGERDDAATPGDGPGAEAVARAAFFDEELLVDRGVDPAEAARLREVYEAAELDRLYLIDRASREGWRFTPRMLREMETLAEGLRAELGDAGYDNVLFASGQTNRVAVADLLSRSPASRAGLQVGDVIVRYDDQPIFHARDLRRATTEGEAGTQTRVDVVREGTRVTVYVPRGPLGVRLLPTRSEPAS